MERLGVMGAIFALINLPFIWASPQAWVSGVLAPVLDPMFPLGVGMVTLSTSGLLPPGSPFIYGVVEGVVLISALVWYYRSCPRVPHLGLLLAVVPLFFAWRSLPSYFYLVPLLVFGAIVVEEHKQPRSVTYPSRVVSQPAPSAVAVRRKVRDSSSD
ncbi:MAG: hypothetical protein HY664_01360 [Chloroflexi bacterium]|nr:hypothetical protein [Chloroflexota bacterium]